MKIDLDKIKDLGINSIGLKDFELEYLKKMGVSLSISEEFIQDARLCQNTPVRTKPPTAEEIKQWAIENDRLSKIDLDAARARIKFVAKKYESEFDNEADYKEVDPYGNIFARDDDPFGLSEKEWEEWQLKTNYEFKDDRRSAK